MDIFSHGLWGGIAFGKQSRAHYWWAFFFGMLPDLASFGLYTLLVWLGLTQGIDWSGDLPPMSDFPSYVVWLYNLSHSLVVFVVVGGVVWLILKRPFIPLLAWPLHIIFDIVSHGREFFGTPIGWPLINYKFDGINWIEPVVLVPNWILLFGLYLVWWFLHCLKTKKRNLGKVL